MPRYVRIFLTILITIVSSTMIGCDITADRELRRAQDALDAADEVSADAHATADYNMANELFQDAMQLSEDGRIQEARTAAIKAKLRAEDAEMKAKERLRILNEALDKLGR